MRMLSLKVSLLIMGGSIYKGHLGKKVTNVLLPEYNIFQDVKAAREIFNSSVSMTLVPLDVTADLVLSKEDISFLATFADKDSLIKGLLEMTNLFKSHITGHRNPIMFDPGTVSLTIDANIGELTSLPLRITRMGFTRIVTHGNEKIPGKNVCLKFDKARFYQLFFKTLTGQVR